MTPLFNIPPGLIPLNGAASIYYVVDHPANRNTTNERGEMYASHAPLAIVYFGSMPLSLEPETGHVWLPILNKTRSDLNEAGEMVRSIILDNLPEHGEEHLVRQAVAYVDLAATSTLNAYKN
jgi:hypothetical protein